MIPHLPTSTLFPYTTLFRSDLLSRLAGDRRIGLGKKALQAILAENVRFVGAAPHQVDAFLAEVKPLAKKYRGAAEYRPGRLQIGRASCRERGVGCGVGGVGE